MYNGVINIYKEKGFTSHDVVAKMRGILRQKKIGHTGTLDPQAEGVLPVCLGNATKLCDMLTDKRKVYEAVFILGFATDTQDTTGTVTHTCDCLEELRSQTDDKAIEKAILSFVGDYEQLPPMYSAIKINGKKLYELAREGMEVERSKRKVHIGEIEILSIEFPRVRIRVECSKGTYIRTLCHDIGEKLGMYACMDELLRIRSGSFDLEHAITLAELERIAEEKHIDEVLLPVEKMFAAYPAVCMKPEFDYILLNGNKITCDMIMNVGNMEADMLVRVYSSERVFLAVYRWDDIQHIFRAEKMFPV